MFNCILFVLRDAQRGFVLFSDPVLSVLISSCFQCELDAMLYLNTDGLILTVRAQIESSRTF